MSEYELVLALNNAEAERVRWRAVAINTGNEITKLRVQIDQLKAQVNQFKRGVESFNKTRRMDELLSAYIETPEQCLAEVKAKVIEDYKNQLAESKQLDLATKIMTVTI